MVRHIIDTAFKHYGVPILRQKTFIDLTGQRFAALTVLEYIGIRDSANHASMWKCRCDCGNVLNLASYRIRTGHTRSCGQKGCLFNPHRKYATLREAAIRCFYQSYQRAAIARNYVFELSYEQFEIIIKQECFYCGKKYIYTIQAARQGVKLLACGLDRVDNVLGYTIENTVPCCKICNIAKASMLQADYIAHCKAIAERH